MKSRRKKARRARRRQLCVEITPARKAEDGALGRAKRELALTVLRSSWCRGLLSAAACTDQERLGGLRGRDMKRLFWLCQAFQEGVQPSCRPLQTKPSTGLVGVWPAGPIRARPPRCGQKLLISSLRHSSSSCSPLFSLIPSILPTPGARDDVALSNGRTSPSNLTSSTQPAIAPATTTSNLA